MPPTISLAKRPIVDLKKDAYKAARSADLGGVSMDVIVVMDRSGSMQDEYTSGLVQLVLDRVLALALPFDADGEVPVIIFHNDAIDGVTLTPANVENYVQRELSRMSYGGTEYAPALQKVLDTYGNKKSGGFLGMGKRTVPVERPTLVLFFTDGDNDAHDKARVAEIMKKLSENAIFVKFIGLDTSGTLQFPFLQKLDDMAGRKFDNADFFAWRATLTDPELFAALLNEVPGAIAAMRQLGYLT